MLDRIKSYFERIFSSRLSVLVAVFAAFTFILLMRLFVLQIIKGSYYQDNYELKIAKKETIEASRGEIYDRNGNLLAYNKLAYSLTITDSGNYDTKAEKHKALNNEINTIITALNANGDSIDNDFDIFINSAGEYEFSVSGTSLQRFRADIFGYASTSSLSYNKEYDFNEAEATADQVMEYLIGKYQISDDYSKEMQYQIAIIRYELGLNSYQKYIATTIASDISDKSVAYFEENKSDLTGVDVVEDSIRQYVDGEYFSSIIGYTGTISTEEYEEASKDDDTVELTDQVGKAGIEQYMNDYLTGTKGSQTIYVDSVGNVLETADYVESTSGNDVYLSIDKDLQERTYKLLEQEIAGILSSKIVNTKSYTASSNSDASDIVVPIYDVYFTMVNNNLIKIDALNNDDSTETEKAVYASFQSRESSALTEIQSMLTSSSPTVYSGLSDEYQAYSTYIVKMLKSEGVMDADAIDSDDETYKKWSNEELSVEEYLRYAIEQNWIDITTFTDKSKYVDTDEMYNALVEYILEELPNHSDFVKFVYKYAIFDDQITGTQLCLILYDQGVLDADETTYQALSSGKKSAYEFLKEKINSIEITPAQLALDPCSGSSVVIDTNTGAVLACVSYPGYDNNELANPEDSSYYTYLNENSSNPLYNYATQQRTAPGSTFKPVSSTAGLSEGIITPSTQIDDLGIFDKVSNKPKCWAYPSTHGLINVSEALRDSCNYFFYEVGWELAGGSNYNDENGIEKLNKYASLYGLDSKTGVEIEENTSSLATEYPVMAAIGQSNNNITTIALARYATALANSGTVYNLSLLDHVSDTEGNVIETYGSSVKNTVDVLNSEQWNAIHSGMRMVVENLSTFNGFEVAVAGKTGTAQQVKTRPNHALFIGYAPYDNPQIAIATRIAYGYTSHNAADVSKNIIGCYFGVESSLELANTGSASTSTSSTTSVTD